MPTVAPKHGYFSDSDVASFDRDGFVIVRGLIGSDEMARISEWTDEVERWPETPGRYMMYFERSLLDPGKRLINRIENFYPYHQGFRALFDDDRVRGRVSELFGEPAVLFKEKINFKYPGGDGFKHHQDQAAGWWDYGSLFISVLISVDESTVENGCLEIAPGNNRHRHLDREWKPFTAEEIKAMPFIQVPTKPGDVIFFDSFVPHGSYPNLSNSRRRILYVTYNRLSEGDHRVAYYAAKRNSYPPDCEREPNKEYVFRV
ncbi:MAG: phytanoyl-CoA dioxygenase family protein [Alphaproteobacteria bacterium]